MSKLRSSVVAVAVVLGSFAGVAHATVDISGEAELGIEKAGKAGTSQTGDVTLTFSFSQELSQDLTFSATTDTTYSVNDTESGEVSLGGSVLLSHTSWGSFEFGSEVGNVFEDAKFADKSELWYDEMEDPAVGYKYSNSFGPLSFSLGYFDKAMDKSGNASLTGFTTSVGYDLFSNLQLAASAARVNDEFSGMLGSKWSDVAPGLTLAANVGSFAGEAGYGAHAEYQLFDNLSTYLGYSHKGSVDDVKVGADYSLGLTNNIDYSLAAFYSTDAETATLENTFTLWDGMELYANVDINDDTAATYGASYTISF